MQCAQKLSVKNCMEHRLGCIRWPTLQSISFNNRKNLHNSFSSHYWHFCSLDHLHDFFLLMYYKYKWIAAPFHMSSLSVSISSHFYASFFLKWRQSKWRIDVSVEREREKNNFQSLVYTGTNIPSMHVLLLYIFFASSIECAVLFLYIHPVLGKCNFLLK